jgi:RNA 2',3'-cyclic 3'-phosphodiesterase
MSKRLFLAIPIPKVVQHLYESYYNSLTLTGVRWTPVSNIHITLHFLGDTPDLILSGLIDICQQHFSSYKPFTVPFKHITLAPPQDPRRMIWAEYHVNNEYTHLVRDIKKIIEEYLVSNGQNPENDTKAAIPHITLARCEPSFKPPHYPLPQPKVPDLLVNEIQLIESHLYTTGSVYNTLFTFELKP